MAAAVVAGRMLWPTSGVMRAAAAGPPVLAAGGVGGGSGSGCGAEAIDLRWFWVVTVMLEVVLGAGGDGGGCGDAGDDDGRACDGRLSVVAVMVGGGGR